MPPSDAEKYDAAMRMIAMFMDPLEGKIGSGLTDGGNTEI